MVEKHGTLQPVSFLQAFDKINVTCKFEWDITNNLLVILCNHTQSSYWGATCKGMLGLQ